MNGSGPAKPITEPRGDEPEEHTHGNCGRRPGPEDPAQGVLLDSGVAITTGMARETYWSRPRSWSGSG